MTWFWIALIAPILWSITNHFDKYIINRYFTTGVGAVIIFSSLFAVIALPIIWLLNPYVLNISLNYALVLMVNSAIWVVGIITYLYALQYEEVSIVVPLFQLIPIFGYILGYFVLKETLSTKQIIASLLIILGAVVISLDLNNKRIRLKKRILLLMVLSSFLLALTGIIFKFIALKADFWMSEFWSYIGLTIVGVILIIFIKQYRDQFFQVIRKNTFRILTLNSCNEVLNVIANMAMSYATLLAPIALVWVVNGFQPVFVFIFGIILSFFFPKITNESLLKRHLIQKGLAIAVIFIGTFLLNG